MALLSSNTSSVCNFIISSLEPAGVTSLGVAASRFFCGSVVSRVMPDVNMYDDN